ncbi:MAG: hypothetical protein EOO09_10870 [Chitinophagaceae bacterium]|nr:MAG: hypothetical protein EOO09_10870 [Chitinophagaceae bacterium]
MKKICITLCVLLAAAPALFSQECKLLRDTDPYTKETRISTGFLSLQGATVNVEADPKELDFFFTVSDRCFEDQSTVFIFFEGSKTRTSYRNAGSMNCDGYFHFKYRNNQSSNTVLNKLSTMKVAQFVFTDRNGKEVVVALLPDQQQAFMEATACLVKEAKTLIPVPAN